MKRSKFLLFLCINLRKKSANRPVIYVLGTAKYPIRLCHSYFFGRNTLFESQPMDAEARMDNEKGVACSPKVRHAVRGRVRSANGRTL